MPATIQSVIGEDEHGVRFRMSDGSERYFMGAAAKMLVPTTPRDVAVGPAGAPPEPRQPRGASGGWQPEPQGVTGSWEPEQAPQVVPAGSPPPAPPPAAPPGGGVPGPEAPVPTEQPISQQLRQQAVQRLLAPTYTAGRDPAREARTGMMVPKGGKVTQEGGMDPDFARRIQGERDRLYAADTQAQVADAEARVALADEARVRARSQATALAVQQREQEARLARMQQRHDEHLTTLQADLDAAYSRKYHPTQLFGSESWQGAVGAIGFALATAFEARGGGRPMTWESVQRTIDRDIARQEAEIRKGIDRGKNALSQYLARYDGDMATAKAALGATQEAMAKAYATDLAARTQRLDIQRGVNDWISKTGNERLDKLVAFNAAVQGKVTREVAQEFAIPKASGMAGPSAANMLKAADIAENVEAGGTAGFEGSRAFATARGAAGGKASVPTGITGNKLTEARYRNYSVAEGKYTETQSDLDVLTDLLGGARKGDAIHWDRGKNIRGIGPIGGHLPGMLAGEQGRRVRQALSNFLNNYINTTNKGPASDQDVARLDKALKGYGTETEIQDAVANMQRKLNVGRRAARAQAGSDIVQAYNSSRRETGASYEGEVSQAKEDTEGLTLETGETEED